MKIKIVILPLFIVYYFLFWKQPLGLNLFVYQTIIYGIMVFVHPEKLKSKYFLLGLTGALIGGFFMMIYNSKTSLYLSIFSHLILLGFYFQTQLKTIHNALFTGFIQLLSGFDSMLEMRKSVPGKDVISKYSKISFKIIILPTIMIIFFYVAYRIANPDFDKFMFNINNEIFTFLNSLFKNFSITWIAFILLGLLITFSTIINQNISFFELRESKQSTKLEFNNSNDSIKRLAVWLNAKEEFYSAIFVLIIVNILLLMVNYLDFKSVWLEPESLIDSKRTMKYIVHSGTYVLIGSIIMAMAMLLYIFKDRQNFIKLNAITKGLAYFWLAQNAFLVGSVLIRNAVYIQYYGIAYKRIGVYIFLSLTLFGIASLGYKIARNKSVFYLLKWNGLAAFILFMGITFVDWDKFIVNHNLQNKHIENMDARFILSRADKTLPLFMQYPEFFEYNKDRKIRKSLHNYHPSNYEYAEVILKERIDEFIARKDNEDWRSWNWAEAQALKKVKATQ